MQGNTHSNHVKVPASAVGGLPIEGGADGSWSADRVDPASGPNKRAGPPTDHGRKTMAVARVTEISATSPQSFEDAIRQGLERATKTLRGVTAAWIKDQRVKLENGRVTEYQVNMEVTFVLEG